MTEHASGPRALALAGLAIGVLLTGCSSSGASIPGTMMDGQAGYHFSPLTCSAPASLPDTTVTVVLADMGMMGGDAPMGARMMLHATPGVVVAGKVSLVAENVGRRTHELVVLPLGQTAAAGERVPGADGKVAESETLGEASASCAGGSGEGIDSTAVGWVTIQLPPGRYELVCNLKNHYANGMYQELDVH